MKEIKEKLHQVILKRLDMAMNETSYTDPYIVPYIELYERLKEKSVPQQVEHSKQLIKKGAVKWIPQNWH